MIFESGKWEMGSTKGDKNLFFKAANNSSSTCLRKKLGMPFLIQILKFSIRSFILTKKKSFRLFQLPQI